MATGASGQAIAARRCGSDPLLRGYLDAADSTTADRALHALLSEHAAPVIERLLQQKNRASGRANPARGHSEDIASAARELLIAQLLALRSGERDTPISDFRAYTAGVAYSCWAQHLRTDNPQRSMLLNRVRYLLENRTRCGGFALWQSGTGRKWCGYPQWESKADPAATPKLARLVADPQPTVREVFGDRYWQRNELGTLIVDLFDWLEGPIELRDLVLVISEILEISDRTDALELTDLSDEDATARRQQPTPDEELAWKEYLTWLWSEIGRLSPPQAASFLLNSNVLREFELFGLASIRSVATRIAIAPEQLAKLWQDLPVSDLTIAAELRCARQQVINLRRAARDKLGAAWALWREQSPARGNKRRVSPSRI